MIANEAMVDFDEQDDFEEEEDSATEDEKVTPWSEVTGDGKTPDGQSAEVMKKIEDEVMEVAHSYDVRTYRKYCVGDPLENTESFSMERPVESGRVRLINDSGEVDQIIEDSSNNLGLASNNNTAVGVRIAKKGSAQPFDMAQDSMTFSADQSTRFQGRFTDQKQAEREQARLRAEIEKMEEANRQQEQQIEEMEKMNQALEKKMKGNDLYKTNGE